MNHQSNKDNCSSKNIGNNTNITHNKRKENNK